MPARHAATLNYRTTCTTTHRASVADRLVRLLDAAAADATRRITQLDMLDEADRDRVLVT